MLLTLSHTIRLGRVLSLWLITIWGMADASTLSPIGSRKVSLSEPALAVKTFDSLLQAGKMEDARHLCTGQVLRMFDFIAMSQSKLAEAVDTAQSTDTTLEEKISGSWAYLKVASKVVFYRPLLGQKEISSTQVIHLFHAPEGWLIAEMEELESPSASVRIRSGLPGSLDPVPNLFPVSPKAPAKSGGLDRMQYRLTLKNGRSLAPFCPLGPEQRLLKVETESRWLLENHQAKIGAASGLKVPADSLRIFLESNGFLILDDSLLIETARKIVGQETDQIRITEKIFAWVVANFRFELGAVLFGTSKEVLGDLTGDCSEAAVLTAALLRTRGIPSRIALGFASVGRGVFIGHAWSEAYLGDSWVGVDAALREFPAGVERIKLILLDGRVDMRVAATNLMMSVLSNLDIEIIGAWKAGKPVLLKSFAGNSAEGKKFFEEILKGLDRH
jgi:hypothetical protein